MNHTIDILSTPFAEPGMPQALEINAASNHCASPVTSIFPEKRGFMVAPLLWCVVVALPIFKGAKLKGFPNTLQSIRGKDYRNNWQWLHLKKHLDSTR